MILSSQYKDAGAEVIEMGKTSFNLHGALWRFLAAIDPEVERYVIRDADSRLNGRERAAVNEWIESGKGLHTMRDHPNHDYAVNAGMWGGISGVLTKELIESVLGDLESSQKSEYGDDQRFLRDDVYKKNKGNIIGHDSYSCSKWENTKSFPTKRSSNLQHVGQVFDGDNNPRMGDITCCLTNRKNPKQCRKNASWEWG